MARYVFPYDYTPTHEEIPIKHEIHFVWVTEKNLVENGSRYFGINHD